MPLCNGLIPGKLYFLVVSLLFQTISQRFQTGINNITGINNHKSFRLSEMKLDLWNLALWDTEEMVLNPFGKYISLIVFTS